MIKSLPELIQNPAVMASIASIAILTAKQAKAIRERDGNRCLGREVGITAQHYGRLEVNHCPPQAWSIEHGLNPDDYPTVALITLCQACHDEYHRHDMTQARKAYHEGDKEAFSKMSHRHHILARENKVFWNTQYDLAIQTVSRQNDLKARLRGWIWPQRKKEGD